jgi:TrmH family RNA methyltransferase
MLSKNKVKYLTSLAKKKSRDEHGVFIAEGTKVVGDILPYFRCQLLCGTKEFLTLHPQAQAEEIIEISEAELQKCSQLKTPRDVIAVFYKPTHQPFNSETLNQELCLMLDGVQDPGNLGTIIRLADWFGINHIICSEDTADAFAPKVIQATMGAITRVTIHYELTTEFLSSIPKETPIYGTFLEGDNIYEKKLSANGLLIMGNEGNGIRPETQAYINQKLFIPPHPAGCETSESLNVAIATAICCAEFRRQLHCMNA